MYPHPQAKPIDDKSLSKLYAYSCFACAAYSTSKNAVRPLPLVVPGDPCY
jgi:hypothetical protein